MTGVGAQGQVLWLGRISTFGLQAGGKELDKHSFPFFPYRGFFGGFNEA